MGGEAVNRVTVNIYGEEYILKGEASRDNLLRIARSVDERMREIARHYPRLSLSRIAVLAALTFAEEVQQLRDQNGRLQVMLDKSLADRRSGDGGAGSLAAGADEIVHPSREALRRGGGVSDEVGRAPTGDGE
ncbi:MAG: cell division protein ZapA [Clostridia bacterium]|nr:cell division protein ZapA [Clostridia bacterium]